VAIKSSPGGQTLFLKLFRVSDASILPDAAPAAVDGVASPAGVAMLASIGTTLATGDAVVNAVGVSTVASVGSAAATGGASTAISGVAAAAAVGTATATGTGTAAVVGVAAAGAIGTATGTGSAVTALAGVALVASVGTALADGGPADGIASPLGVEMVAAVGTATAGDGAEVIPVAWGGGPYRVRRSTWRPVVDPFAGDAVAEVSGVQARARVGRATASGAATASPAGLRLVSAVGMPAPHGVQNPTDEELAWLLLMVAA